MQRQKFVFNLHAQIIGCWFVWDTSYLPVQWFLAGQLIFQLVFDIMERSRLPLGAEVPAFNTKPPSHHYNMIYVIIYKDLVSTGACEDMSASLFKTLFFVLLPCTVAVWLIYLHTTKLNCPTTKVQMRSFKLKCPPELPSATMFKELSFSRQNYGNCRPLNWIVVLRPNRNCLTVFVKATGALCSLWGSFQTLFRARKGPLHFQRK